MNHMGPLLHCNDKCPIVPQDNITITSTHTSTSAAKEYIQPYLHKVSVWTKQIQTKQLALKSCRMPALRTATGCTQYTNIQHVHDETLILPIHEHLQLHASQYKQKHNIHHTPYTNISTDPHTITTTDIKTNMCHIHTSIVSRYLATRGNNSIMHTPQPHISNSEEIHSHLTLAQLRTNKSPFLIYLHKVDAKSHPSPLCPLCCNTHTHDTHHLFNCTTLSPLDLWTDPVRVTAPLARWT